MTICLSMGAFIMVFNYSLLGATFSALSKQDMWCCALKSIYTFVDHSMCKIVSGKVTTIKHIQIESYILQQTITVQTKLRGKSQI